MHCRALSRHRFLIRLDDYRVSMACRVATIGVSIMKKIVNLRVACRLLPVVLLVAACGNGDDTAAAAGDAAVKTAGDASVTDMGLDASTMDAMSVDVAAGGVDPAAQPVAAAPAAPPVIAPEAAPAAADPKAAPAQ